MFGMVHGHKEKSTKSYDIGWLRSDIVKACKNKSFIYYGNGWKPDKNYAGESYPSNSRDTPDKFKDARKLMAPVKFTFCIENLYCQHFSTNYLTEKIFNGFLSYSVPIYVGCANVEEIIDPTLFIDLRKFDFNIDNVIKYCEKMPDSEYNQYLERIEEFLNTKAKALTFNHQLLNVNKILRAL